MPRTGATKKHRLTLLRLATHDFNRSLRVWLPRLGAEKIFGSLIEQRARSLRVFLQTFVLTLLGVTWLQAGKIQLALKFDQIELTVPTSYINFAIAMVFSNCLLTLLNYFVLNEFVRVASNRLFKFDNPVALSIPIGGENAWSLPLLRQYRFFSSNGTHLFLTRAVFYTLILPFFLLVSYIAWSYFSTNVKILIDKGVFTFSGILCVSGSLMVIFPVVYTLFLFLPLSFHKNAMFIRWLFLFRMYKKGDKLPDHVALWAKASLDSHYVR